MMQHGALRVALCFLAKFGLFYFFVTSIFAFLSMCVLLMYYTNAPPDGTTVQNKMTKPAADSQSQHTREGSLLWERSYLHLASSLRFQLGSDTGGLLDDTSWASYGRGLLSFVNQTAVLPSCQRGSLLTILITSAPRNFKHRSAIRQTWCSPKTTSIQLDPAHKGERVGVQCVFLLGQTLSKNIQKSVDMESRRYSDILQGSYLDTYRNLTLKVLNGFHWSSSLCPSSYVLKTDDDCFVNVPVLRRTLQDQAPRARGEAGSLYVGHVMSGREVIRDPRSKWQVSTDDFRASHYPAYVSGSGYLLSGDLVDIVVTLYDTQVLIPIEDAYIGILMNSVGVSPLSSARFSVFQTPLRLCNYLYLIVHHKVAPAAQSDYMAQSLHSYTECTQHQAVFSWN